jgi:hypothetical protein
MFFGELPTNNGIFSKKKNFFKKSEKKRPFLRFFLATNRFYAYIIGSTQGVAMLSFLV